ncbi:MAG: luciferase family protein [Bacteroidota bacterium]
MFGFTIKYFGFLKFVPGAAHFFDTWLKLYTFATKPILLDWMDSIRADVLRWDGIKITSHKYGGMQFNYSKKEIGHIHGNGLLDMLLNRKIKEQLLQDGRIQDHHSFKNTGWISFWIRTEDDKDYAVELLRLGYQLVLSKSST